MDYLVFSSASKIVATVTTYPYQVVRTRLQDQHAVYSGVWHCIKQTFVREGIYGLYKGMLAATFKQLPGSVITYMVYEYARYAV
ncbi:Mitochondrial folate transporter/carrier [Aphelenchoides avenae]|nr:Mitochondrial folate transporter/carrier [Aphelenchus avenae]